ncbi:hypothetical protein MASR2M79_11450 [Aminivibrio sp.]
MNRRKIVDRAFTALAWGAALALAVLLFGLFAFVLLRGWSALSLDFLLEPPRDSMTAGGIMTPLIGTLQLVAVSMAVAIPIGTATGLYFAEYARNDWFAAMLRLAIRSLSGVPSVVFGLFGLSLFVVFFRFGPSLIAAGLTLACLTLPLLVCIRAGISPAREYRDASYALGASKWQTIRKVVIPAALPTILTGII